MHLPTSAQIKPYLKALIVVMAAAVGILCVLLFREYRHLRELDGFAAYEARMAASFPPGAHTRAPATAQDIPSLQTWMTFDYIDHWFMLPPDYLKTTLAITDDRYPRLTITHWAKDASTTPAAALAQVQNALRAHFAGAH